jgi:hypothetical protein
MARGRGLVALSTTVMRAEDLVVRRFLAIGLVVPDDAG